MESRGSPTTITSSERAVRPGTLTWRAGVHLPPRALLAAALVSLALGLAVSAIQAGGGPPVAPAVRRADGFSHEGLLSLPLAAQGPVSAAISAGSAAYRITASSGGFTAANPAQRLNLRFGPSGVSAGSGATDVGLSLRALGYGTSLTALGGAAPRLEGDRVVYARGGLSEWYANGPLGLEQGFTIAKAPSGRQLAPLTLSLALSGDVRASAASDGQSITLSHPGGASLRYGGLSTTDASGRAVHSWLELRGGRLLLRVDARGARYPLRIDPFLQQGEQLNGSGEDRGYGFDVALSADGNTALIGVRCCEDHAAWVFTRSGETWTQQGGPLTDHGGYTGFGSSVALSADGDTALIGAPTEDGSAGSVWVFTRSEGRWTQQGPPLTGGAENGNGWFGSSVALSSDGDTALIGGPYDGYHGGGEREGWSGAAWVFTRSGETWTQQGEKLTGGGESAKGDFGSSVALSSDGDTALIGGSGDAERGAAWVFTRSGEAWTQQGEKLTGSGESGYSSFGSSVALSSDGDTALIGGDTGGAKAGAAWVFARSGETWTQQGEKLTGSGEVFTGTFGGGASAPSVALSSDGDTALVGTPLDDGEAGAAWVFARSGETWTQQGEALTGSGDVGELQFESSEFGASVALASEGDTALIGGFRDNVRDRGEAYVFAWVDSPTVMSEPASSVAESSATLNATVNPNGEGVSGCYFEYGTSTAYGSSVPCTSVPGPGEGATPVSAALEGLGEGTTYHFRIVASNSHGTSYGGDRVLSTQFAVQYGRCVKVPAEKEGGRTVYHGGFTAATCLLASAPRTGRYEWDPGVLKPAFRTSLTAGVVTLQSSSALTKVTCTGETGTGEYTGPKSVGSLVLALTGCKEGSSGECSSAGAAAGEIVTADLEGILGVGALGATRATDKIGLDLYPAGSTGPFMQFSCGATSASVTGSVIVPFSVENRMQSAFKLKASASKARQVPEGFVGLPRDVLQESFDEERFPGQVALTIAMTQTNEEEVEVDAAL